MAPVTDSAGKSREVTSANCQRVISEDVANAMNSLLSSVVTSGTGRRAMTADGRPQAGKTGTIDSNAAVWYVGYTPQVAGAAMISIDNTRKPFIQTSSGYQRGLKGYTVPSTGLYLEGSGSGDAGRQIWKPAMQKYLKGKPREQRLAEALSGETFGEPWIVAAGVAVMALLFLNVVSFLLGIAVGVGTAAVGAPACDAAPRRRRVHRGRRCGARRRTHARHAGGEGGGLRRPDRGPVTVEFARLVRTWRVVPLSRLVGVMHQQYSSAIRSR